MLNSRCPLVVFIKYEIEFKIMSLGQLIKWRLLNFCFVVVCVFFVSCQESQEMRFLSFGTSPVGGTFPVVGGALAEILNSHRGNNKWKVQIKGSKGSQENIRRLNSGEFQLGMCNSAISYFASRGESSWSDEGAYNIRAVCTLAPLVAMFVTKRDTGIQTIGQLRDKRVVVGPAGAGFGMFVFPILEAHGVGRNGFTPLFSSQGSAVDMLRDGSADAAFLGGALPAQAIIQATASFDVFVVPYDPKVLTKLIQEYDFFKAIPHALVKSRYGRILHYDEEDRINEMKRDELLAFVQQEKLKVKGVEDLKLKELRKAVIGARFGWLNVGSMQVITHENVDKQLIKNILKVFWVNRFELAKMHPALGFLNPRTILLGNQRRLIQGAFFFTGIKFHDGAIEFFSEHPEIGVQPNQKNVFTNTILKGI